MLAAAMLAALVGGLASLAWAQGPAEAAFPGKNGRIAFHANRDGNVDVFSVRADGTGLRRLTDYYWWDQDPSFSADGEKIAFESRRGDGHVPAIWIMNADGTRERQVTFPNGPYPDDDKDFGPATWSPDGKRIVYFHVPSVEDNSDPDTDYSGHVYALNLSNGREMDLTPGFWGAGQPSWSPDGRRIAFVGSRTGQEGSDIYTMKTDGTGLKRLTDNESGAGEPQWSPDSSKIVFRTDRTGEVDPYCDPDRSSCDPLTEIYVMDRDGSDQTRLTHPVIKVGPGENSGEGPDSSPAFSPNGRKIVFARGGELWVMRADGAGQKDLTASEGDEGYSPSWQPLPRR